MIKLKIKTRGHVVDLPGHPSVRTPATIKISKLELNSVLMMLRKTGIRDYEIISGEETKTIVKEIKQPQKDYDERFNRLESLISKIMENKPVIIPDNKEQINDKLDRLERLITTKRDVYITKDEKIKTSEKEEEISNFIPEIDLEDMKVKSSAKTKTIKQDANVENAADLLANLTRSKKE